MPTRRFLASLTPAVLALAACSSETVGPPQAPPVDWSAFEAHRGVDAGPPAPTAKERAVAESYALALGSPSFDALTSRLDPDVHFAFPGMADRRGREAVVKAHADLFGAFDSRVFAVRRVWRTASVQTLEWTMTGVQARPWLGVAPAHAQATIHGVTLLWTKDDGSISDIHVYFDVPIVKAQLGGGPKDLAAFAPALPAVEAPEVFEQTGSPEEAHNVDVARGWVDALEKGNEGSYLSFVADDVGVRTQERAQPLHGKDDLRGYFKGLHKSIGQLDTTVEDAWGVSRFAIVEYFIAGEQLGAMGWIPAQRDKVLHIGAVDIVELANGKIAHVERFDNAGEIVGSPMP
jgi:hypothetical protein